MSASLWRGCFPDVSPWLTPCDTGCVEAAVHLVWSGGARCGRGCHQQWRCSLRIAIGTDSSECAREACDWVITHLGKQAPEVILVFVAPAELYPGTFLPDDYPVKRELEQQAHAALDAAREHFEGVASTVETELVFGDAAEKLLEVAAEKNADLIVVGSRGMGSMKRLLLGSVAGKIASHADRPVLIVRPSHG